MASRQSCSRITSCASKTRPVLGRCFSLCEQESQNMLRQLGVSVPRSELVRSVAEVRKAVEKLGPKCLVKAQFIDNAHSAGSLGTGPRGEAQMIEGVFQGETIAKSMLGPRHHTRQSTHCSVKELCFTEMVETSCKMYLAMTMDRENYKPIVRVSKWDGSGIPGVTPDIVSQIKENIGPRVPDLAQLGPFLERLFDVFCSRDAILLEMNPLSCTPDGRLRSVSSRFVFDDAAAGRQADLFNLRNQDREDDDEVEAARYGLIYVKMRGNIGTVVNGAGLAMATTDAIQLHGGASANFLDAGGRATKETMQQAFGIIARDKRIRAILVNIYGGLTRCDMIAESIINAAGLLDKGVPMVVRLQGTNSQKGLELLKDARLGLHVESDFGRAALRAVELAA